MRHELYIFICDLFVITDPFVCFFTCLQIDAKCCFRTALLAPIHRVLFCCRVSLVPDGSAIILNSAAIISSAMWRFHCPWFFPRMNKKPGLSKHGAYLTAYTFVWKLAAYTPLTKKYCVLVAYTCSTRCNLKLIINHIMSTQYSSHHWSPMSVFIFCTSTIQRVDGEFSDLKWMVAI